MLMLVLAVLCLVECKREKKADPKECEVCIANLEMIDALLVDKKDKVSLNALQIIGIARVFYF